MFPPSVHTLSIHASFKYFSAIPCIVLSIVSIKSLPSVASVYSSAELFISPPFASLIFVILPLLPFNVSSYNASIPSNP